MAFETTSHRRTIPAMIGKSAVSVKKLYQRAFLDAFPKSL
jgi:hypothetical protein